jgi:four helix bundle protein
MKTKHQRSTSKHQTANPAYAGSGISKYALFVGKRLVLNDCTDGNETPKHPFDLEERTARFGEAIVRFSKKIPRSPTNDRLIDQLVGSGTSIGGNYCEANEGVSKRDFAYIISRCTKEAKETKFFLRMIAASEPQLALEAREHYREAKELHLIFASIFRKTKSQPFYGGRRQSQLKVGG